jgi:DNA-binding IclR family transcriptional regulator
MKLTKSQQKLLRAIEGFQTLRQNPSQRELSKVLGVTQPAIYSCLQTLERKGVIRRDGSKHRTIEILIQSED